MSSTKLGWKRCVGPARPQSSVDKIRAHSLVMENQKEGWLLHRNFLDCVQGHSAALCGCPPSLSFSAGRQKV